MGDTKKKRLSWEDTKDRNDALAYIFFQDNALSFYERVHGMEKVLDWLDELTEKYKDKTSVDKHVAVQKYIAVNKSPTCSSPRFFHLILSGYVMESQTGVDLEKIKFLSKFTTLSCDELSVTLDEYLTLVSNAKEEIFYEKRP